MNLDLMLLFKDRDCETYTRQGSFDYYRSWESPHDPIPETLIRGRSRPAVARYVDEPI